MWALEIVVRSENVIEYGSRPPQGSRVLKEHQGVGRGMRATPEYSRGRDVREVTETAACT